MRPFLTQDPGEHVVRTAHAVGSVFRIMHCQGDGCCQQSPRRNRIGKRSFQPQVLVFRLPPDAESALEIIGMNPDPTPRRSPRARPGA